MNTIGVVRCGHLDCIDRAHVLTYRYIDSYAIASFQRNLTPNLKED